MLLAVEIKAITFDLSSNILFTQPHAPTLYIIILSWNILTGEINRGYQRNGATVNELNETGEPGTVNEVDQISAPACYEPVSRTGVRTTTHLVWTGLSTDSTLYI